MKTTTSSKTRRTYTVTQIQGSRRLANGSDGKVYISCKTASGKWSRWVPAYLTAL